LIGVVRGTQTKHSWFWFDVLFIGKQIARYDVSRASDRHLVDNSNAGATDYETLTYPNRRRSDSDHPHSSFLVIQTLVSRLNLKKMIYWDARFDLT
jgi:hypothetical protein